LSAFFKKLFLYFILTSSLSSHSEELNAGPRLAAWLSRGAQMSMHCAERLIWASRALLHDSAVMIDQDSGVIMRMQLKKRQIPQILLNARVTRTNEAGSLLAFGIPTEGRKIEEILGEIWRSQMEKRLNDPLWDLKTSVTAGFQNLGNEELLRRIRKANAVMEIFLRHEKELFVLVRQQMLLERASSVKNLMSAFASQTTDVLNRSPTAPMSVLQAEDFAMELEKFRDLSFRFSNLAVTLMQFAGSELQLGSTWRSDETIGQWVKRREREILLEQIYLPLDALRVRLRPFASAPVGSAEERSQAQELTQRLWEKRELIQRGLRDSKEMGWNELSDLIGRFEEPLQRCARIFQAPNGSHHPGDYLIKASELLSLMKDPIPDQLFE
jgi:hypothetical protein